ncbi:MAG: tellurite resistance TerB family protein [Hyphomonadaceae bacterium]|nr:tellurite resistance TerB family protein [Hyphomonadaceae bacterium]
MGALDRFRSSGDPNRLEEAAAGVLLAVIRADGEFQDEEVQTWKAIIYRHPIFRRQPPDTFNPMMERVRASLDNEPWREVLARWSANIPAELRPTVFALAIELVLSDETVTDSERTVIGYLQNTLQIPDQLASNIISVISIRAGLLQ